MNHKTLLTVTVLAVVSFSTGFMISKRFPGVLAAKDGLNHSSSENNAGHPSGKISHRESPPLLSTLRSRDNLESILQVSVDAPDIYRRLSLWLLDASKEDIATYWQNFRKISKFPNDLCCLIFVHWTRVDLQHAMQTLSGDKYERYVWWAWPCHDPQAAFTTALNTRPDQLKNVVRGIGEFQHAWVRDHLEEIPAEFRDEALKALTRWGDRDDPLKTYDFARKAYPNSSLLEQLLSAAIVKDPLGTFEWLSKDGQASFYSYGSLSRNDVHQKIFTLLAETDPLALSALIEKTPSGEIRRAMEKAQFQKLIETDPDAAMTQASKNGSVNVAVEQYAMLGTKMAARDSEKAFEIFQKLAALNPGIVNITQISSPGTISNTTSKEAQDFTSKLFQINPQRMVEIQFDAVFSNSSSGGDITGSFSPDASDPAAMWAREAPEEYAEWLGKQPDSFKKEQATEILALQLGHQHRYEEAMAWETSIPSARKRIDSRFSYWLKYDQKSAREWLSKAKLSDYQRDKLQAISETASSQSK